MKSFIRVCLFGVVLSLFVCSNVKAVSNYYFSVDIGSDLEVSDPAQDGNEILDPGDIYFMGPNLVKDDILIFQGVDPDPFPLLPIGVPGQSSENYFEFFDMDGEDQLDVLVEPLGDQGTPIKADEIQGLWKEPNDLHLSFDDDQALGWPANNVPVTVSPTHGKTVPYDEVLTGNVWRVWSTLSGAIDEVGLGLGPNPDQGEEQDDDVDALDVEEHQFWYWTCDHEAHYNHDPGAIYVTDRLGGGGVAPVISQAQLGLIDDPNTSNVVEDADVDAFEFCTTDDDDILEYFGLALSNEYLAVVFSVDEDDPLTGGIDESGGLTLSPSQLYISLLTGAPPMPLLPEDGYQEDIDAIAFGDEAGPEELLDFGDAPSPYPTLLPNNGARHVIVIGGPYLGFTGNQPDPEADGQQHPQSLGDDNDGNDDERGVWFPQLPNKLIRGITNHVQIIVGSTGYVQLWADWNKNGSWADPGEDSITNLNLSVGSYFIPVYVPAAAALGTNYSRCRISSVVNLPITGLAPDGEVEDHQIVVSAGTVQWCNLQWPHATTTNAGAATETIYGRVYETNVTDNPGPAIGLTAELGYGPDGADPTTNAAIWTWVQATYNQDYNIPGYGMGDEYMATVTVAATGRYDYTYRYSINGGIDWSYGDIDSNSNGYTVAQAGDLVILEGDEVSECSKWRQPPDCQFGLDLPSFAISEQEMTNVIYRLADDWWCDGRPITAIRWWGSYIGNEIAERPSVAPVAFILRWYTNKPDPTFARPGGLIKEVLCHLAPAGSTFVPPGDVTEIPFCPVTKPDGIEFEFEYYVELEDPWVEKEGNIYWLNIEAIYSVPPATNVWGWATSSEYDRLSDAVVWDYNAAMPPETWLELFWPEYPYLHFFIDYAPFLEPHEKSLDLAFEMLTEVCPARCKKWEQLPDMIAGTDKASWRKEEQLSDYILRADDWICDGRPITDIHWWGSYMGWKSDEVGTITNPIPWPTNAHYRLLGFDLSWHKDIGCLPGAAITNIFVDIEDCYEVFYGTIDHNGTFEHEYQYYVDLLDVDGPWNEVKDEHYWLNIQAVFPQSFVPGNDPIDGWGWVTTPGIDQCPSAKSADGTNWVVAGTELEPFDLAFELTTTEIPATNSPFYKPVKFIDLGLDAPGATSGWLVSTGGTVCGIQILQEATNLLDTPINWVDLVTNTMPNPLPYVWQGMIDEDILFYRIMQKNK